MFEARAARFVEASVVARDAMALGDCIAGPAIITENETTTIITDAQEAVVQADGCLLVRSKA
jgi:N-methylhydantoinase A